MRGHWHSLERMERSRVLGSCLRVRVRDPVTLVIVAQSVVQLDRGGIRVVHLNL